jgi:uncharacterized protein YecE (DUF72 family)
MRLGVGTSGYNYEAWRGSFYPEDLPKTRMLTHYASQLPTVEINYTFYRMPNAKTVAAWAAQTPDGFTFALKAPQRITHQKRLRGAGDDLRYFVDVAHALGAKLGPVLFQLPPNFKKDAARLHDFLEELPDGLRAAFEFRHASWSDDDTARLLGDAGCALCCADTDEEAGLLRKTAPFGYLRLRRADYSAAELTAWAERVRSAGFDEAYVYFKHEDEGRGPRFAREFQAAWGGSG